MTTDDIKQLIDIGKFPVACSKPTLIETHISWVILCDEFVFKIKKPIHYSFIDFSSIEKRLFYLTEELRLNWRLTFNVYLDIVKINKDSGNLSMGRNGVVVDHALRMRRLPDDKRMDLLLENNLVAEDDIKSIALRMAMFHQRTKPILDKEHIYAANKFSDIKKESAFLSKHLGSWACDLLKKLVLQSDNFLKTNNQFLQSRIENGYYRDGHGDLHSRNIFLIPEPVIFDCIEFDKDYRMIDVLNEIAFLCMDLDAFDKPELSDLLLNHYCKLIPLSLDHSSHQLFIYYKGYRANVRAKVNSLRAKSAKNDDELKKALEESKKYLLLTEQYMKDIS